MHPAHDDEESTKVKCTKYVYANTDAYSNNYLVEVQGVEEVVELLVLVALVQSKQNQTWKRSVTISLLNRFQSEKFMEK